MPAPGSGSARGAPTGARRLSVAVAVGLLVGVVVGACAVPSSAPGVQSERAPVTSSRASPERAADPSFTSSPTPTSATRPDLDRRRVADHVRALGSITDEHGGTRALGTAGYGAAAQYVSDVLRAAGYRVTTQPFEVGGVPTTNVLAEARGGRHVVMLGAHLDSVAGGPGINDNASGVAALLAVAEAVARRPTAELTVRFAFWGAEEGGPFGSRAYVDATTPEDRAAIVAYLNFDMLASPNAVRFVYAERDARAGSRDITQRFAGHFERGGLPWEPIDLFGDSDHGPFNSAGIATGGLFTGGIEPVTDEQAMTFGAVAGQPADPCSHSACDTIDNVDLATLEEMTEAILAVLGDLVDDPP